MKEIIEKYDALLSTYNEFNSIETSAKIKMYFNNSVYLSAFTIFEHFITSLYTQYVSYFIKVNDWSTLSLDDIYECYYKNIKTLSSFLKIEAKRKDNVLLDFCFKAKYKFIHLNDHTIKDFEKRLKEIFQTNIDVLNMNYIDEPRISLLPGTNRVSYRKFLLDYSISVRHPIAHLNHDRDYCTEFSYDKVIEGFKQIISFITTNYKLSTSEDLVFRPLDSDETTEDQNEIVTTESL